MTNNDEAPTLVKRQRVPEEQRLEIINEYFGEHFPLLIEPTVYAITERIADSYSGGYWDFWLLDNDGFYMAPAGDETYLVNCDNQFTGELSADALGITACLYAYSHCSFSRNEAPGKLCGIHYHLLRLYMFEHPEVDSILRAID